MILIGWLILFLNLFFVYDEKLIFCHLVTGVFCLKSAYAQPIDDSRFVFSELTVKDKVSGLVWTIDANLADKGLSWADVYFFLRTVTRRNKMTKTIPLAEAKKSLSAIIKDVDEKYDRFTITKNGVDAAVILSSEEFEGFLETLDILSRKEEREAIARAKNQVRTGKTVSLNDFKARLKLA